MPLTRLTVFIALPLLACSSAQGLVKTAENTLDPIAIAECTKALGEAWAQLCKIGVDEVAFLINAEIDKIAVPKGAGAPLVTRVDLSVLSDLDKRKMLKSYLERSQAPSRDLSPGPCIGAGCKAPNDASGPCAGALCK